MTQSISILTYNIHGMRSPVYQRPTSKRLLSQLEKIEADVICLQEVLRDDPDKKSDFELKCESAWPYSIFGFNVKINKGFQGNLILSKMPILKHQKFDLSIKGYQPRSGLYCQISKENQDIAVVNIHLGLNDKERVQQWDIAKSYLNKYDPSIPILLAGDFNDWNRRLHQIITASGYNEVSETMGKRLPRTFPANAPVFPLDRMYARNFKVDEQKIFRSFFRFNPSDHLPYLARFITDRKTNI